MSEVWEYPAWMPCDDFIKEIDIDIVEFIDWVKYHWEIGVHYRKPEDGPIEVNILEYVEWAKGPIDWEAGEKRKAKDNQTDLYRYFDKDDQLLYVGISFSAIVRAANHRNGSGWWDEAVKMTIEKHATRDLALSAEYKAIKNEGPLHNKMHAEAD